MAEQSTQKFARAQDDLSEKTFSPTLKTSSTMHGFENFMDDDLILALSERYENRRAVQVFEWESIRVGRHFRREV